MTRLNIRLQLTDPAPTLILTVIPLVLIPFMMPAFKSMLLADGYTGVTGAEQAVPSIAILFSFLAVQNIIGSFFNERSWGTWKRLEASPTSRASILTGKALVAFLMQTVQIAVVLALGALIFGYRPTGSLLALAAILLSFSAVLSALRGAPLLPPPNPKAPNSQTAYLTNASTTSDTTSRTPSTLQQKLYMC